MNNLYYRKNKNTNLDNFYNVVINYSLY